MIKIFLLLVVMVILLLQNDDEDDLSVGGVHVDRHHPLQELPH